MSADLSIDCRGLVRGIAALTALLLLSACGEPAIVDIMRGIDASDGGPDASTAGSGGASGGMAGHSGASSQAGQGGANGGEGGDGAGGTSGCREIEAETLPARKEVTTSDPTGPVTMTITVTADDLFTEFEARTCGNLGCHGGGDEPDNMSPTPFKLTRSSFDQRPNLGDQALARVLSLPAMVMPPNGTDGTKRGKNDPYRQLAERLKAWQDEGFPEQFEMELEAPEDPTGGELPEDPYLLTESLAAKLTNIGSCLPDPATPRKLDEMRRMDEVFENIDSFDELPGTLIETDLVSLDSEVLAHRGVFSYAPTYTLFSDNASKMRYVRVPVGKAITYDPQTGDFDIPENTRFYKTFLKPVTDADGNLAYRKMETRLIVSRRDEALPDGSFRSRALRMSYAWDKDEKMARLVTDPFRNGQPFADRMCPYVVDERVTRDPFENPINEPVNPNCTYMTQMERAELTSGSVRHYAIPSSERCDQCHMGSSSRSYILGFTPWQADRRASGEGGVYDKAPTEDEIAQLRRLIDYGVIKGIEPGEAKLEESQGERAPRNDHELKAQAYMIGNCAFCHNPNGFPTVQNPLLKPFNMFPDHESGGVFQFPLERTSPRAKFGDAQQVRFPYITPAFGNFPLPQDAPPAAKKYLEVARSPVNDPSYYPPDYVEDVVPRWWVPSPGERPPAEKPNIFDMLGPWRSLIWRNVYTPFTYSEGATIFIHMPRNVPDYDCRAHKIMASWMLSIPSEPKGFEHPTTSTPLDQPYVEILPGAPGYDSAVRYSEKRVEKYLGSVTGQNCPSNDDTVDPSVVRSPTATTSTGQRRKLQPAPVDERVLNSPRLLPDANDERPFEDYVPNHAHWVPVDTTDPAGRWIPRRSNWKAVIASREVPVSPELSRTIDQINTIHLTEAKEAFSLTPQPLGLWHPDCTDFAMDSPTVADLQSEGAGLMRRWLFDLKPAPLPLDGRVHYQSRGEAVFRAICQNCHGKGADSRSPLSTTILEISGGQTRVANFVDGLFGPRTAPGAYADDEFVVNQGATPKDWHVRYMLFMTMGGTEAEIPGTVLSLIAKSPFYGQGVTTGSATVASGNMLQSAAETCEALLKNIQWEISKKNGAPGLALDRTAAPARTLPFLRGNAHFELWESICGFDNEPLVRAFALSSENALFEHRPGGTGLLSPGLYRSKDRAGDWVYPATSLVGNQYGEIELGIQPDNTMPWCVRRGAAADELIVRERFLSAGVAEDMIPFCPDVLTATAYGQQIYEVLSDAAPSHINDDFRASWLRQGAMNAGIAAYFYLDRWTKGELVPLPTFDACRN